MSDLSPSQIGYLIGLNQAKIKDTQRGIDNFRQWPEQSPEQAAAALARFHRSLRWRQEVQRALENMLPFP